MNSPIPPQFAAAVAELPAGLQEIVVRELALGNTIVDTGHSFPAAPIGVYVKMLHPLAVPAPSLAKGITFTQRPPNSQWTREYTDEKRYSFVIDSQPPYDAAADARRGRVTASPASPVTPAAAPIAAPAPEVSAVPTQREIQPQPAPAAASPAVEFPLEYSCKLDFRGETLTYVEAQRSADMQCFWTRGYMIEANTITEWVYRDGQRVPVSDEDRLEIVRRVVLYAKQVQGVVMVVNT